MSESSSTLTGAQKRALKSRAQLLEAVIRIGQSGVTDALLQSFDNALSQHELVKVRFADFKEERKTLAPQLAERTSSALIQQVGNVAVFFRKRAPEATHGASLALPLIQAQALLTHRARAVEQALEALHAQRATI